MNAQYILSFPKAGRTWVRFLLGNYLRGHYRLSITDAQCLELKELTADLAGCPQLVMRHDRCCARVPVSELPRDVGVFRGSDVTLLVRDPRDVVVSWFFEKTKRYTSVWGHRADGSADPPAFIRSEFGIALVLRWMQDWGEQLDVPARVRFFRYEDFRADTETSARELLEWLGVTPVDEAALRGAVVAARFDAMRSMEASSSGRTARTA